MDKAKTNAYDELMFNRDCLLRLGVMDIPTDREIGLQAVTPKRCSCWMCGHRRWSEGPTKAEVIADELLREHADIWQSLAGK